MTWLFYLCTYVAAYCRTIQSHVSHQRVVQGCSPSTIVLRRSRPLSLPQYHDVLQTAATTSPIVKSHISLTINALVDTYSLLSTCVLPRSFTSSFHKHQHQPSPKTTKSTQLPKPCPLPPQHPVPQMAALPPPPPPQEVALLPQQPRLESA